ncbi:MAG: WG repeat-containing protein, partial [Nitrospinae bacterium]|nr:WG repeat-containing protein [Nitrospinota bacterium]
MAKHRTGKIIIKPQFDFAFPFHEGLAAIIGRYLSDFFIFNTTLDLIMDLKERFQAKLGSP